MKATQPLANWSITDKDQIHGVFSDIDDTLTTEGQVSASVFDAMERLRTSGLSVFPITGRPAGWCDMIARTWPVNGVVGENGALAFRYDSNACRMLRIYADTPEIRNKNQTRLKAITFDVLKEVPGVTIAADQPYRETDLAIDFAEDVTGIPDTSINQVVEIFKRHGATAKVSSIHVNGWFGNYNKLTMTQRMMFEFFDIDLEVARKHYVFVGDSPNDAPMFSFFSNAVGVANLVDMLDHCTNLPPWITTASRGAGFVEFVDYLLEALN